MRVATLGLIARNLIEQSPPAHIVGVNSRGVFVGVNPHDGKLFIHAISPPQFLAGWVTFLSTESFRGPLTFNVVEGLDLLQLLETGQEVEILPGGLFFPTEGLFISTLEAIPWQAPPHPEACRPPQPWRVNLPDYWPWDDAISDFPRRTEGLSMRLRNRAEGEVARQLQKLLGLGSGLTPAGDDFSLGVLLALNRWGEVLLPGLNVPKINQAVIASAYEKTTTLSANLIECAAQGQADERLIFALDGMMTGQPDLETVLRPALGWGESSGRAALEGMDLAIKAGILA